MSEPTKEPLVLVVEDYQDAREMYAAYLQFSGYRVAEATNGLEALDRARELMPDIILMDLALPKMDGWEATRQLKMDEKTRHIPIVALTDALVAEIKRMLSSRDHASAKRGRSTGRTRGAQ
jgi:CheY-like chemotaxis protein